MAVQGVKPHLAEGPVQLLVTEEGEVIVNILFVSFLSALINSSTLSWKALKTVFITAVWVSLAIHLTAPSFNSGYGPLAVPDWSLDYLENILDGQGTTQTYVFIYFHFQLQFPAK